MELSQLNVLQVFLEATIKSNVWTQVDYMAHDLQLSTFTKLRCDLLPFVQVINSELIDY